jgi:hypothetical protein
MPLPRLAGVTIYAGARKDKDKAELNAIENIDFFPWFSQN